MGGLSLLVRMTTHADSDVGRGNLVMAGGGCTKTTTGLQKPKAELQAALWVDHK